MSATEDAPVAAPSAAGTQERPALRKVLAPMHIWALGVGIVLVGEFMGWNFAVEKGGMYGALVACWVVGLLYTCIVMINSEVTSAIPAAGGQYAQRPERSRDGHIAHRRNGRCAAPTKCRTAGVYDKARNGRNAPGLRPTASATGPVRTRNPPQRPARVRKPPPSIHRARRQRVVLQDLQELAAGTFRRPA